MIKLSNIDLETEEMKIEKLFKKRLTKIQRKWLKEHDKT